MLSEPKLLQQDFITLFNVFWYRDFPLTKNYKDFGSRAEWTTHIGICVRSCADLLGYFTYFESGGRTDAIIKDNQGFDVAHIEWEWWQADSDKVNEIKKLHKKRKNTDFSVFISYSKLDNIGSHERNLKSIEKQWGKSEEPLVVFLITFLRAKNLREFYDLETYIVRNGKIKKVRSQPALPWDVRGTRWEIRNTNEIMK
ncbi:MAG: hypothetical protein KJZ72_15795 [Anaerolineales bacterium]|nr:hypothetical protein [Anaerolineales bacterium]